MIVREVCFYNSSTRPFGRADLLLLVEYELESEMAVESGYYDPKTETYHYTGGDPVRGTVRAWAGAPVITHQEL